MAKSKKIPTDTKPSMRIPLDAYSTIKEMTAVKAFLIQSLEIRTKRLVLKPPSFNDPRISDLYKRISGNLLDEKTEPWFSSGWHEVKYPKIYERATQYHLKQMLEWKVSEWNLSLIVHLEDTAIGELTLRAKDFPRRRSINTGSWLDKSFRGQGYGREMRAAGIYFGFEALRALEFRSDAHKDNTASRKTSLSLGYLEEGGKTKRLPNDFRCYLLTRDEWKDDTDCEINGFADCRECFAL